MLILSKRKSPFPSEKSLFVWISLLKKKIYSLHPYVPFSAPKKKSLSVRISLFLFIWQPTFIWNILFLFLMHVDIWKVHTCDSHWTLSQRCSPHLGLGKVDCVFPFLKMWKSPPLVTCDSLRECVEIHSFFGVSSVWKVFGVSLRMFGHFSNLAACISSMECIDSSMELMAVCVLMILSSACWFSLIKKSGPQRDQNLAVFLI